MNIQAKIAEAINRLATAQCLLSQGGSIAAESATKELIHAGADLAQARAALIVELDLRRQREAASDRSIGLPASTTRALTSAAGGKERHPIEHERAQDRLRMDVIG